MRELLNYLPQRLLMCYRIFSNRTVLLITNDDKDRITSYEVSCLNVCNSDLLNVSTELFQIAIEEQRHYRAVDNLMKNL